MTVTTNERNQQNLWAKEPQMYVGEEFKDQESHNVRAEKINGIFSIIGIIAGIVSYSLTNNFFFGAF
jgi:hypothetical protein